MVERLSPDSRILAAELFLFHAAIAERVRLRFPRLDPDQVDEAFVNAVMELARKPEQFDSKRGTWPSLLYGATRRTLRALYRSDTARCRREGAKGKALVAEQESAARNPLTELLESEAVQTKSHEAQMIRDEIARTDEERRVLQLWESGVEDPSAWACALGVAALSAKEQAAHVTRVRKRLLKRIERLRLRKSKEGDDQ